MTNFTRSPSLAASANILFGPVAEAIHTCVPIALVSAKRLCGFSPDPEFL